MPQVRCIVCNLEFHIKPSHQSYGWGKYCTNKCYYIAQSKGSWVKCSTCDKEIYRSPNRINRSKSGKFFCSKSCQTKWRNLYYSGEKSINWVNGGSSYRDILIRSQKEIICILCGIKDEILLNAHHKDHNRSNNKIENLVWLCLNCHYLVHHDQDLDMKIREK